MADELPIYKRIKDPALSEPKGEMILPNTVETGTLRRSLDKSLSEEGGECVIKWEDSSGYKGQGIPIPKELAEGYAESAAKSHPDIKHTVECKPPKGP